jgi:hypothetical protein
MKSAADGGVPGGPPGGPDVAAIDRAAVAAPDKEIKNPPQSGDKDANGFVIQAIFASTRQFVIYESGDETRYTLPDDYDVAKILRAKIAELGGLRASIEDLKAESAVSAIEKHRAAREVAWALALAFENAPPADQAKDILVHVDARLRSLVKSNYRKTYVFANLAAFALIELVLIIIAICTWKFMGTLDALHRYALYGAFGGLGAFLSVITGIRSIDVDIDIKGWEHVFAGATRILIGVIGALVVGLALDSHLIDPTFGNSQAVTERPLGALNQELALRSIFAFIAGFSESLVPNLLRRGEQSAGATDPQNTQGTPDAPILKPAANA